MSATFTPGPWTFGFEPYEDGCPYICVSAGEHGMFEDETGTGFHLSGIASEADGRLIAKAPDLVEALKEIAKGEGAFSRDPLEHAENTIENMREIALAALAEVRGEQVSA